jgi:hypothetical protein
MKNWNWKKLLRIIGSFIGLNILSFVFYELADYAVSIENYWLFTFSSIFFSVMVIVSFIIPYEILI